MDKAAARRVADYGRTVMAGDWNDKAVKILLEAANHDTDVQNADAAGYLRGRNAAIEAKRRNKIPQFS